MRSSLSVREADGFPVSTEMGFKNPAPRRRSGFAIPLFCHAHSTFQRAVPNANCNAEANRLVKRRRTTFSTICRIGNRPPSGLGRHRFSIIPIFRIVHWLEFCGNRVAGLRLLRPVQHVPEEGSYSGRRRTAQHLQDWESRKQPTSICAAKALGHRGIRWREHPPRGHCQNCQNPVLSVLAVLPQLGF